MAEDTVRLGIRVDSRDAAKADTRLKRLGNTAAKAEQRVNKSAAAMSHGFNSTSNAIVSAAGKMVAAIVSVHTAVSAFRLSGQYQSLNNSLRALGFSSEEAGRSLDDIADIAQRTRAPLQATATLYQRISIAGRDLNATQAQILRFTENVGLALAQTGGSSAAAAGALLQLSQAMSGGIVRAEEFNSILEGAFPIAQAAANAIKGAAGSVGKLRNMIIKGEITSKQFFDAILSQTEALEKAFANTVPTASQGFTVLKNSLTVFLGKIDEAVGANKGFAKSILSTSDSIKNFTVPAIEFLQNSLGRLGSYITTATGGFIVYRIAVLAAAIKTAGLTSALGFLRVALIRTGIGALVVGAGELIYQFTLLAEKTGGVGKAFEFMWNYALSVLDKITDKVKTMVNYFALAGRTLQAVFFTALGDFEKVKEIQKTIDTITADLSSRPDTTFIPEVQFTKITEEANQTSQAIRKMKQAITAPVAESTDGKSFNDLFLTLQEQNAALSAQIETFGFSEGAVLRYTEQKKILAEVQKNNIKLTNVESIALDRSLIALERSTDALNKMGRAAQIFKETRTPLEVYEKKIEELNVLLQEGYLNYEDYTRGVTKAQDSLERMTASAKTLGETLDRDVGSALERVAGLFARFVSSGGAGGFSGLFDSVKNVSSGLSENLLSNSIRDKFFGDLEEGSKKAGKEISKNLNLGGGDLFDGLSGLGDKISSGIKSFGNDLSGFFGFSGGGVRGAVRQGGTFPNSGLQSGLGPTQIPTGFGTSAGGGISAGAGFALAGVGIAAVSGIVAAIQGDVTGALQGGGAAIGAAIGFAVGGPLGALVGGFLGDAAGGILGSFFSSTKKTIGAGLDLIFEDKGVSGFSYKIVKKKSFFKKSVKTYRSALDQALVEELNKFNTETRVVLDAFGEAFGVSGIVSEFIGKARFSTLGLSKGEIKDSLERELDGVREEIAQAVVGSGDFVRTGETFAEAAKRMAEAITSVNAAFEPLSLQLFEISRAGADAASRLVETIGGLEKFTTSIDYFYNNFFNAQERLKINTEILTKTINEFGIDIIPQSRRAFRDLVTQMQAIGNTDAVAALFKIAPLFIEIAGAANAAAQANAGLFRTLADQVFASSGSVTPFARGGGNESLQIRSTGDTTEQQLLRELLQEIRNGNIEIIRNTYKSARIAQRMELKSEAA